MATTTETLYGTDIEHKRDFRLTSSGDFATISGKANVTDAIFRRIVTMQGSIIHRPEYGVGIQSLQNTPNTIAVRLALAEDIRVQLTRDDRVAEVKEVTLLDDPNNPDQAKIRVRLDLVGLPDEVVEETFIAL